MHRRLVLPRLALPIAALVILASVALPSAAADSSPDRVIRFALEGVDRAPVGWATSADGDLWFADSSGRIGRVSRTSDPARMAIDDDDLPQPDSSPGGLTVGGDGAVWFTEPRRNVIGRFATDGTKATTEITIPTPASYPLGITTAADGTVWFVEAAAGKIGRIDPAAPEIVTEFPLPDAESFPTAITFGPDGALWFTQQAGSRVGRIESSAPNALTEWGTPTEGSGPGAITTGPDGALWFVESYRGAVGRVDPRRPARMSEVELRSGSFPTGIATGPDGAVWATDSHGDSISRIEPFSEGEVTVTSFGLGATGRPGAVTAACDGGMWIADEVGGLTRLAPVGPDTCPAPKPQPVSATGDDISVLGSSQLSAAQIAAWFESTERTARLADGVDIRELARIYVEEGALAGVRGDVAFAQSVLETGSFSFPDRGQVRVSDNNFAGLGACDSCADGRGFASARDGARAQMQHLRNYGDPTSRASDIGVPPQPSWYGSDPVTAVENFDTFFAKGDAPTWRAMGNGNWATSTTYAEKVLGIYSQMVRHARTSR